MASSDRVYSSCCTTPSSAHGIYSSNPGLSMQSCYSCMSPCYRHPTCKCMHARAEAAPEIPAVLVGDSRLLLPAFDALLQAQWRPIRRQIQPVLLSPHTQASSWILRLAPLVVGTKSVK